MRLPGQCTECRRFRQVRVRSGDMWKVQLGRTEGVCAECEALEQDRLLMVARVELEKDLELDRQLRQRPGGDDDDA